jgi:hypothetical protein
VPSSVLPAVLKASSPLAGRNAAPAGAEMLMLDSASRGKIGAW